MKSNHLYAVIAVTALGLGGAGVLLAQRDRAPSVAVAATVGDVRAVHDPVQAGTGEVRGDRRLSDGDVVKTGPDGRARVRLDDGTLIAVDGSSELSLRGKRLTLERGRVFVQAGPAARTEVLLLGMTTTLSSSAVAFERRAGAAKIYCAQGEIVLAGSGGQTRVSSGETALLGEGGAKVVPEKAFDDWTSGLAVPWSGELGEKSAIPELRGITGPDDPGTPFVIRSQKVEVTVHGELAVTKARTTYFNGASTAARGSLRFALPEGAILNRVARRSEGAQSETQAALGIAGPGPAYATSRVEWAGGGWYRGDLGSVKSGETVELILEWSEWLTTRGDRATYRFPMASDAEPPLVGELSARVELGGHQGSRFVSASAGAALREGHLELHKSDLRPTGDLVVELAPDAVRAGAARAYVMSAPKGEDPFVMVRTEVPDRIDPGLTLAVVVDTSMSAGAATLETQRAVLDAVLEGLGERDAIAVLAADQTVRPVGPGSPKPVTAALRSEIRAGAAALRPGGASNLGLALQQAADLLDAPSRGERAGSGLVVYIGDGRPSVGEPSAEQIRRLIARRPGGLPRLAAVAVGGFADRWLLAELVAGLGGVYEVEDRSDAARAGATLLSDALSPTLRDVELDLGPNVDRIYPREARALHAGSTVTVLGRLRGDLPRQIGFRFRDGAKVVNERRALHKTELPPGADLPRRWAEARIQEMAARGDGIEPAIALARNAGLVTPWTSFFFEGGGGPSGSFQERVLALSPVLDTPYAEHVTERRELGSTLLEPEEPQEEPGGGVSMKEAAEIALRRILQQAASAVRACRDARAATRPDVSRSFEIEISIDGGGRPTRVHVGLGAPGARTADAVLERCVRGVVQSLPYFAAGIPVTLRHTLTLPEGRGARRSQCSPASKIALPLRLALWRARALDADAYVRAAQSCELPKWNDRRAFLLLLLTRVQSVAERIGLADALEAAGESDAGAFVRRETLRRVTTFDELQRLNALLMQWEPRIDAELEKAYAKAESDAARLEVVQRFLRLSPHNVLARKRLFSLLDALGKKDALLHAIDALRAEPFADAGLLAQAASALRRSGHDEEGQRAFGELVERAPRDPWTLAFVGDRLRAEGMFDAAGAAYESLSRALPGDAAVTLRLSLAHAGAGRLDLATRLLERVTQTGGRGDDGRLGELASITQAVLLADARSTAGKDADAAAELERRLLATPLPDVAGIVLVQAPPADDPVQVRVANEGGERDARAADFDAHRLGISASLIERGAGPARIVLRRRADAGPGRALRAQVAVLVLAEDRRGSRLVTREVDVLSDGKPVELRFSGEAFL